ncbi:hypothetical protein LPC10_17455 [Methylorubrum sp. B1-46]|uniref:hypothetical protein n=1 Tax=Methylorubrum TaxID=2282523 RepID=UPI001E2FDF84|nr:MULTISPECIES: hypothetical protein [Methylorubrum]MCG5246921.1 hypothetical protein [Methylorubrum extorquens]UGB24720.1 hypothetical protein LPC10_17455 [Methylorubrum sp. B1-46]
MNTKTYDRSAILRAAWNAARSAAAAAGEGVRKHIGSAMRAAWTAAKATAMVPQIAQLQQACAASVEAEVAEPVAEIEAPAKPARIELELGRGRLWRVGDRIRFYGEVTGGGANGPGNIEAATGFEASNRIRFSEDNRSGSKRSGSCLWELDPDRLYALTGVAYNSRTSESYWISTFGGTLTELSRSEYRAELRRLYPLQADEHDQAQARRKREEEARIERERAEVERRRIEREALAEQNAAEADRIEAEGQREINGMPALSGTPKQVAYALKIRDAVRRQQPTLRSIKTATTAKYWIETHRSALYR